jgi:uncharacterized damage-inducible protein DinB
VTTSSLKQLLLDDADYTGWASQQLLGVCSKLTPAQLDQDLGASHASLIRTLRHIYFAERIWLRRLVAGALPPLIEIGDQRLFDDGANEPSLEDLVAGWPEVWRGLHDWIDHADDDTLTAPMSTALPNGEQFQLTRWEILTHAVNHSTLHRGQIIGMLRALGVSPPNVDTFSYYLARGAR